VTAVFEPHDVFLRVLRSDLRQPVHLTAEEVDGGWRSLFPELARRLPAPYPIFSHDEARVIGYGFPVLVSSTTHTIRREVDKLVALEIEYRLGDATGLGEDKSKVMAQRDRYLQSMTTVMENTMLNDYGRGLVEVLILFSSAEIARLLGRVPALLKRHDPGITPDQAEDIRHALAGVFADLIKRAAMAAADALKRLANTPSAPELTPLLAVIAQDRLLFTEVSTPLDIGQLSAYLRIQHRQDASALVAVRDNALEKLNQLLQRQPSMIHALSLAARTKVEVRQAKVLLQPSVLDALAAAGVLRHLGLSARQIEILREVGLRLKRFELLSALRRRILPVEHRGGSLVLAERSPTVAIARSTRPFDFTRPGVVDSAVRRFGLIYDLTNFTAVLEEVRKKGRMEEEKALQFMYVFQRQLEEIRNRRRLTFEKFLGDGAFYSSRRALRIIAAAAEIQLLYDRLRHEGFPFNQGIRMAMNFGTYRLLPMLGIGGEGRRFEFFGHGMVELARLTTGKSVREVEEIAEFLVHSGYDPSEVDSFLRPLEVARGGREEPNRRSHMARIDARGELVNEGIVCSVPFVTELEGEFGKSAASVVDDNGTSWVVLPADPEGLGDLHFGLRYLGVARLKGLPPIELVEASVWAQRPEGGSSPGEETSLIELLRRVAQESIGEAASDTGSVPEDLVVATFLQDPKRRVWIFGEYRQADDILLHAIQVPIQPPDMGRSEPVEMWLFRNRSELAGLYETLRRDTSGRSIPLHTLRRKNGYQGCFLAAPHRVPG